MKRWLALIASLVCLCIAGLSEHIGSAADVRGTLANGWQRHPVGGEGSAVEFDGVYAGDSGFLALSGDSGWVSADGKTWKPAPQPLERYALSQHIPDLNLTRVGIAGAVKGYTYSVRKEGPNGGYIAVGSYQPAGQPVTKTRAEVALSADGISWRHVSDKGKTFLDAGMADVARGGPGWVAAGYSIGPLEKPVVWTSTDAIHWQRIAQQPAVATYGHINRLIHGPGGLLAVSSGLDGSAHMWISADGLHWEAAPGDIFRSAIIQQVTTGGPGYLAAGVQDDEPTLWASSDGLHWQHAAGAASFPGDLTRLTGVAARGSTVAAVGWYETGKIGQFGIRFSNPIGSAWVWTPQSSALTPTPVPRTGTIDSKLFRLRLADLPDGFMAWQGGGWPDFCDDGNTLCRAVNGAVGSYEAYETSFVGPQYTTIESMSIQGSRSNPHALAALGVPLVHWWNRGGKYARVSLSGLHIGQDTRIYRGSPLATSIPPGGHFIAYAVEWRDGRAIGQVYVEQQPRKISLEDVTLGMAVHLAQVQWQHLRDARG